jgi:hypothetical protein
MIVFATNPILHLFSYCIVTFKPIKIIIIVVVIKFFFTVFLKSLRLMFEKTLNNMCFSLKNIFLLLRGIIFSLILKTTSNSSKVKFLGLCFKPLAKSLQEGGNFLRREKTRII